MEYKKIEEFRAGETIQGFFMVKDIAIKTTNTNNKYLDFTLGDKTGEINAKLWDYSGEDTGEYKEGMLIKVRGMVTEWQNKLQLKIDKLRLANENDGLNIKDFVQTAPYEPEKMLGEILKYVIQIKKRDIKEIVSCALNEKKDKLMYYPAAMKNHHSIRSGLLYHILTMLKLGERVKEIYPFLDRDLLYAGIILHDLEKIEEMNASDLGIVSGYTTEGLLLGHIIQGVKMVERIGKMVNADSEIIILLQHMILSHHYEPEFGSPKRPMIPEAEILHYLDVMDARLYDMRNVLENAEKGSFSDKVWTLHNRQLYKYILDEEQEEQIEYRQQGENKI